MIFFKPIHIIAFLLAGIPLCAQNIYLDNSPKLDIACHENEIGNKCKIGSDNNFYLFTYTRPFEYFTEADTLHKDFITWKNSKIFIDSLCKLQTKNYTISFDLITAYSVNYKDKNYIILKGVNGFQIGSDQQTFFIVLQNSGDNLDLRSTYLYDSPEVPNDVIIEKKKKNIILKSKYLKIQ